MMPGLLRSNAGFTYIAALFLVMVMGIMLGAVGQSVQVIMKREREKELIFRGLQYRDAIERWTKKGATPLLDIKNLLRDPRSAAGDKYLRQLYTDPITGGDWRILKDPNLGIYGVASTSEQEPLKVGNFPDVIKDFKEKKKYSEWEFIYKKQVGPQQPAQATSQQGAIQQGAGQQFQKPYPLSTPEGD